MNDTQIKILASIGFCCLVGLFLLALAIFIPFLKEAIETKKLEYRQKHRFDKPPTAACYCKDCVKWSSKNGECGDPFNERYMADSWFCCFAEPRTLEQEERLINHEHSTSN